MVTLMKASSVSSELCIPPLTRNYLPIPIHIIYLYTLLQSVYIITNSGIRCIRS